MGGELSRREVLKAVAASACTALVPVGGAVASVVAESQEGPVSYPYPWWVVSCFIPDYVAFSKNLDPEDVLATHEAVLRSQKVEPWLAEMKELYPHVCWSIECRRSYNICRLGHNLIFFMTAELVP